MGYKMSPMEKENKLSDYINNPDFIDFYCYKEDKWLQYAGWKEKLTAVFGSIENALEAFDAYAKEEEKI